MKTVRWKQIKQFQRAIFYDEPHHSAVGIDAVGLSVGIPKIDGGMVARQLLRSLLTDAKFRTGIGV